MDKVIVPTNLMSWPRVKKMVPDHKLIYLGLWQNPAVSPAGAYFIDLDIFSAFLGFARPNLEKAIDDFCELGLILFDCEKSEIMILDWWRFHKCETNQQVGIVQRAVDKLVSDLVLDAFFERIKHVSNKINDLRANPTLTQPNLNPTTTTTGFADVGAAGNLKFPRAVSTALRPEIEKILFFNPHAQEILDELGAALTRARDPVRDPLAWLRRVAAGGVYFTLGGLRKKEERKKAEELTKGALPPPSTPARENRNSG